MRIEELYQLYKESFLVDTDTRKIRENSIYFALKGENFNGNKFAIEALEKGASYAVVDEKEYASSDKTILVDNVLETLQMLATYHREQLKIPIIGLTGSNGKTTSKELINAVLSEKYKTHATIGNLNNHIGVPLTLLQMTPEIKLGIVEMGANHQKEIDFLCRIAKPNFGYITNFGKAHLEGFGGLEGVVKGKTELYRYIKETNGLLFVNSSIERQMKESEGIERILFGSENDLPKTIFKELTPFVKLELEGVEIQSNLIGIYNYTNIAAAISIGHYFKVENSLMKTAIEKYVPTNNRSQILEINGNQIILDAYNANPSSMKVALENFSMLNGSSKIVFLGDMFEVGETSAEEHEEILKQISEYNFEKIFLLGKHFSGTKLSSENIFKYEDFDSFKTKNRELLSTLENKLILIKGSRGMALERIIPLIKNEL
ncbi:UDP-N-acetylmuramoyl-tripeptide--D-alanyl-D-alanine ligase [Aureivirga sp. CE67]|uniref:UDP-N-acetylmuramoyl-tripeptide--D-alanyl-D- alanine ligase n=1 Tax=Aureivirga sp. CE67 TaxID=1788983 RepID=UPI0018C9D8E1|nr:UDP-N-acetylmuramoyl-tripeptide--D-alanyl-D-alanine ligase [Aureivirga sp. CE67]